MSCSLLDHRVNITAPMSWSWSWARARPWTWSWSWSLTLQTFLSEAALWIPPDSAWISHSVLSAAPSGGQED